MKRVLIYYPLNRSSVIIETVCENLVKQGHRVFYLSISERGELHQRLSNLGVECHSYFIAKNSAIIFYIKHIRKLLQFCRKHKIEFIWSHLQQANLIASISNLFRRKQKVHCFRHHAESSFYNEYGALFGMKRNKREILFDKIINRMGHKIVAPSSEVYRCLVQFEKCPARKAVLVPYIYDFSKYAKPDIEKVRAIRNNYDCSFLLIMVSRMIESKQHLVVFEAVKELVHKGLDIRLIVTDIGPLENQLKEYVLKNELNNQIIFVGYKNDIINYMAASDILVHPSLTEASSFVVKEMGLIGKPAIVCGGVGDFDDYIVNERNSFFLNISDLRNSVKEVVNSAYNMRHELNEIGIKLRESVINKFSASPVTIQKYLDILK